jgi:hypothetical protein
MPFASTSQNKRIIYATQGVAIGDMGASTVQDSWKSGSAVSGSGKLSIVHGLQSMGVDTNFNLEQIFEFAQLSLYENYEEVPDIQVQCERVLDGYSLLYHLGTVSAVNPTLIGRSDARADVRAVIGLTTDTAVNSGDAAVAEVYASGMYVSSVSYNLSTDGNFTESVTFVGNDKAILGGSQNGVLTNNGSVVAAFGTIFGNDSPAAPGGSVLRRQNLVVGSTGRTYGGTVFRTVVPSIIPGVTTGGAGIGTGLNSNCGYINVDSGVYINSISTSVDLGREEIRTMGQKLPYYRYVSFPVDVTTDIEVTAAGADNVQASGNVKNLSDHSIQFVLDDSTVISLGNKNKVTSVSYGNGDTGGGNATISYSFVNSNDFVVLHSGDPNYTVPPTGTNYWKNWF